MDDKTTELENIKKKILYAIYKLGLATSYKKMSPEQASYYVMACNDISDEVRKIIPYQGYSCDDIVTLRDDYASEIVLLEGLLSEIPEDRVIDRIGLQSRLDSAQKKLKELGTPEVGSGI
jgi:hypothetical protein